MIIRELSSPNTNIAPETNIAFMYRKNVPSKFL